MKAARRRAEHDPQRFASEYQTIGGVAPSRSCRRRPCVSPHRCGACLARRIDFVCFAPLPMTAAGVSTLNSRLALQS
ncbi:MAG: hypothetical protein V4793_43425, partial [Paraburkholderia tropica]